MRSHGLDICPVLDGLLNDKICSLWVVLLSIFEQKTKAAVTNCASCDSAVLDLVIQTSPMAKTQLSDQE